MEYPNMQPFKSTTIKMKDATNDGIGKVASTDDFNYLMNDKRFHCIVLDDNGMGRLARAHDTKGFIGVLAESYNKSGVSHTVVTQGIVPIKAVGAIFESDIGQLVSVSNLANNAGMIEIATASHGIVIGKVMGTCEPGGYAPILIGMY